MTKKDYDALWWQYFAECGTTCGVPLPSRMAESVLMIGGYITGVVAAADTCRAAGQFTMRGMLVQLAAKSPAAYQWFAQTFPPLIRVLSGVTVSGTFAQTGTVALARALTLSEAAAVSGAALLSAALGFTVGAAAYASLRIRGFDLGAEGTTEADFFAWQSGNRSLNFFDWSAGAFAAEQQGEDLRARLAKRKSQTARALANAEARHKIKVPQAIHTEIRNAP